MARFIAIVVFITMAGLSYVYCEIEAVKIGYTIRKQEEMKTLAIDRARALKYNIARLKSPHNLERKLLAQKITLDSPKQWQTLFISSGDKSKRPESLPNPIYQAPLFTRLFVGTAQAEAKDN